MIVEALGRVLDDTLPVFDPFAGVGVRLGALCDTLNVQFSGVDLEVWADSDPRVRVGDATNPDIYPLGPFRVVTSPTYGNGLNDHHEPRDMSTRYTYRVALGGPLHRNNTGRYGIRGGRKAWHRYWRISGAAIACWAAREAPAVVNVKAFIHNHQVVDLPRLWETALLVHGYRLTQRVEVPVTGIRHGANHDRRIDHEVILVADRGN